MTIISVNPKAWQRLAFVVLVLLALIGGPPTFAAVAAPEVEPRSPSSIILPNFDTNTGHSPAIGTVPLTVVFNNTTQGVATSFTWDYGDGATETVPDNRQVMHAYTEPNIYHVSLTATDSNGQDYTNAQQNNAFARPVGGTYFEDVTVSSGTSAIHQIHSQNRLDIMGNGIAWCDVNADGNLDLMVTNNGGANWLFMNSGPPDYTFSDEAAARGVDDPEGMSAGVVCLDYDNDADKDLFVQNFAPGWAPGLPKDRLFQNDGTGHFLDVAPAAGLADGRNGQSSAWADFDQDGLLDVFVVFHTDTTGPQPTPGGAEDRLYHQNPDHTFSDVTHYLSPATSNQFLGFQATWTDFDLDGDLDLYVANDMWGGPMTHNVMWRNDGPGCQGWCFNDVSTLNGTALSISDMGMLVADLHNDRYWDIFNSNLRENHLLRGRPGGRFRDVTAQAGVARPFFGQWASSTWGMAAIDYDNDKYQDIYLVAGYFAMGGRVRALLQPNALFHNRGASGAGVFDEVSVFAGVDNELKGRTVAYADYNQDGAVDLYLSNFGEPSFLYRNTLNAGNWLQLELEGQGQVPRDPAGTTVKLITPDGIAQYRIMQIGTGLGNGHDLALYFGLGDSTSIQRLLITWPDGQITQFTDVTDINRRWKVIQPEG